MVAFCDVYGCPSLKSNKKLSFFSLPKEEDRRKKWLEVIDRPDLADKKYRNHFVCSLHFDKNAIKWRMQLENDAVPTLYLPNQPGTSGIKTEESCEISTQPDNNGLPVITINSLIKKSISVQTTPDRNTVHTQTLAMKLDSPQKRKLQEEIKVLNIKKRKVQYELNRILKEIHARGDDKMGQMFARMLDSHSNLKNKPKGNRFDPKFKLFALSLHYSSPQTYRYLQKSLNLPSEGTLRRFNLVIPSKFEDRILKFLSYKLQSLPEKAKYFTLCIDEMMLNPHLQHDALVHEMIDQQDLNAKVSEETASHAYVLMLRSIVEDWKMPIAYTLIKMPEHYTQLETWLDRIIVKLNGIGIDVQAIVSDQCSNFDEYAKDVKKVTPDKPYFMLNDKKIYYIFDVPHLIICIRNNLMSNDFIYDGKQVSWKFVEDMFHKQKEEDWKMIPKVTERHIKPNHFQKMQIKYAAQILSRSVSVAINVFARLQHLPQEAKHTAEFVEIINNVFDVLNSTKFITQRKFEEAFLRKQYQIDTLEEAASIFERIVAIDKVTGEDSTERLKTFKNIQITIRSILMLSQDLEEKGMKVLYTQRFNQEPLENIFGDNRQHDGAMFSNPTPAIFKREFTKFFISNMTQTSELSNSQEDFCELLQKAENLFKIPKPSECRAGTSSEKTVEKT